MSAGLAHISVLISTTAGAHRASIVGLVDSRLTGEGPGMLRAMDMRNVGNSGLRVSAVGLGCNNLGRPKTATADLQGSQAVVNAALDAGITFFDTANNYGATPGLSEELLGKALGKHRGDVVVATKFGMPVGTMDGPDFGARGSRSYILSAVEGSLKRLNTDYIDLYQFHTPDPATPIEETLETLNLLVTQGKVRYIGHSNRSGWQIAEAAHVAAENSWVPFVSAQNHYNLIDRRAELEVIPAAAHYGVGVLPYFPLANGLLTGKYSSGKAPSGSRLTHARTHLLETTDFDQLVAFGEFAAKRKASEVTVAFAWLLSNPTIASVIAGATRPEQVIENAQASQWELTQTDLEELDQIFPVPAKIALF